MYLVRIILKVVYFLCKSLFLFSKLMLIFKDKLLGYNKIKVYHLLNETGNILIKSDQIISRNLPQNIRSHFSEAVFLCVTMMKAMTQTINPNTNKPFSIYNYHALETLILGSGKFYKVFEEIQSFKSNKSHHDFSNAFYESLFGISLGYRNTLNISSILTSMTNEAHRMLTDNHSFEYRVGFLTFMIDYNHNQSPSISLLIIHFDINNNSSNFYKSPWKNNLQQSTNWDFSIDNYVLVSSF